MDVAVSIGEAAKPRVVCCVDVAVSLGEAAKPRVFSCVDIAMTIGEAAKPRVFCCVDVAVSIGEAAKPRVFCYTWMSPYFLQNIVSSAAWMSPCLYPIDQARQHISNTVSYQTKTQGEV